MMVSSCREKGQTLGKENGKEQGEAVRSSWLELVVSNRSTACGLQPDVWKNLNATMFAIDSQ